ncbi:MAG: hypothetical protein EOO07_04120 [Chitinophagaceae bacterium]|nr:MAG: hypothetical protein EOO07_04120 [Chitinophagaceae bacterium]
MKDFKLGIWLVGIVAIVSLTGIVFALTTDGDKESKKEKKEKNKSEKNTEEIETSPCIKGELVVDQQWQLPSELKEVSGIAYVNNNRVAAVQDQKGIIFIYDLSTSKLAKQLNFGPDGDYEGIVSHNSGFYIVRSDGQLTHVDADGKMIKTHKLPLSETDNIESLCLDQKNNRLLLAQKDGGKGQQIKKVFAFDLKTGTFNNTPVMQINFEQILSSCGGDIAKKSSKKKEKKSAGVRPSEMAIDPKTGDLLIADGPSSRIFVLDPGGKFKHIFGLDKKLFPQAEGLSFTPNGELYVSTEGTKDPAMIALIQPNSLRQ